MQKSEDKLSMLVEDSYYHDLNVKEKISTRANVVFTLQIAAATLIGYLYKNIDYYGNELAVVTVSLFVGLAIIALVLSVSHSFKSFANGYNYCLLPTASELLQYNKKLSEYDPLNSSDMMANYLNEVFARCSDKNSELNITRSHHASKAFLRMKEVVICILLASLIFFTFNLDLSSERYKLTKSCTSEGYVQ